MKRVLVALAGIAILILHVGSVPLYAGGAQKPPKPAQSAAAKPPKTVKAPKPAKVKSAKAKPAPAPKPAGHDAGKSGKPKDTAASQAGGGRSQRETSAKSGRTATSSDTTDDDTSRRSRWSDRHRSSDTTDGTTGETVPSGKAVDHLEKNPKLAATIEAKLPAGTDALEAADGFRNFGQFNAAVNVSHAQGIDFMDLKAKVVDEGLSFGRALQELKVEADSGGDSARTARRSEDSQ